MLKVFVVAQIFDVPGPFNPLDFMSFAPHNKCTLVGTADYAALILVSDQFTNTASASQARVSLRSINGLVLVLADASCCLDVAFRHLLLVFLHYLVKALIVFFPEDYLTVKMAQKIASLLIDVKTRLTGKNMLFNRA